MQRGKSLAFIQAELGSFVLAAAQESPKDVQGFVFDLEKGEFICPCSCSRMQQNLSGPGLYVN